MRFYTRLAAIVAIFLPVLAVPVYAQSAQQLQPIESAAKHALPLRALYRHFLAYQTQLDKFAINAQSRGTAADADTLKNYHRDNLQFTESQFSVVRASGIRLVAALEKQDAKASAVIQEVRARFPQRRLPSVDALPPVPPELNRLQAERDSMIDSEIVALKSNLGAEAASKLDSYLQTDFAPQLRIRFIETPGHRAPSPTSNGFIQGGSK